MAKVSARSGISTALIGVVGLILLIGWRPVAIVLALVFVVMGTVELAVAAWQDGKEDQ